MGAGDGDLELVLLQNRLQTICREMGIALMKTAYSPVFSEGFDFVCALFDRDARMIAQAEYNPSMLGAANFTVRWILEEIGADAFLPGDVWIHNDPYRGGCHLPEHAVIRGLFAEGELVGFAAAIGHIAEIGGKALGGLAGDATDIYQEGLRLPPVRLVAGGEDVLDIWKILLTNHRTPKLTWGDIHSLMAALHIGEQQVGKILAEIGPSVFRLRADALIARSERWMRSEIARIPDGEYTFEDSMDDDGIDSGPFRIHVRVIVRGEEIVADFSESAGQTRGPINATFAVTASATYNAVFQLTDANIPRNWGCYRPIRIVAPPGSITNVIHPAPEVGGNSETQCRIIDVVMGALATALPDVAAAADGATGCNFLFGGVHPDTGEFYSNYHFENVGWGGAYGRDGNSSQVAPLAISRNTPVEVFESRYPWLTRSFALATDSGGAGEWRGGLGTERTLEVRADEIVVSALFDRTSTPPWGLDGGREGGKAEIVVRRRGEREFRTFGDAFGTRSVGKFTNIPLRRGDVVRLTTSGGGGFGDPRRRDRSRLAEDIADGFVSSERAREHYGISTEGISTEGVPIEGLPIEGVATGPPGDRTVGGE